MNHKLEAFKNLDPDLKAYAEKNIYAWEIEAEKRFRKNTFLILINLLWAFLALFTEYGSLMTLMIVLSLFTKFILEPWSKKGIRKSKGYNNELD